MKFTTIIASAILSATTLAQAPPAAVLGELDLGPHTGPDGWMAPPGAPEVHPPYGDPTCWYLKQPAGEWINICEKKPSASQTVVQTVVQTYPADTPKPTKKSHPHLWRRPGYHTTKW